MGFSVVLGLVIAFAIIAYVGRHKYKDGSAPPGPTSLGGGGKESGRQNLK